MLKIGLLAATMLTFVPVASAQSGGASGQFQQIPPPPELPKTTPEIDSQPPAVVPDAGPIGEAVRVQKVQLTGATVFDENTLLAAGQFTPDSLLSLGELKANTRGCAGDRGRHQRDRL